MSHLDMVSYALYTCVFNSDIRLTATTSSKCPSSECCVLGSSVCVYELGAQGHSVPLSVVWATAHSQPLDRHARVVPLKHQVCSVAAAPPSLSLTHTHA